MTSRAAGAAFLAENLLGFEAYARAVGLDPATLLSRAGLPTGALDRPGESIPFAFGAALLQLSAEDAGDPLFGFRLATHQSVQFVTTFAPAALAAPTIRAGIERTVETFRHYSSATIWELTEDGACTLLLMRRRDPRLQRPPQLTMHAVTMAFRLVGALFERLSPRAVRFDHARPGNVQMMRRFFRVPLSFDQPAAGLVFDARDLDQPTRVTELRLAALLGRHGRGAVGAAGAEDPTVGQLRSTIDRMLGSRSVTLQATSHALRLHSRTLRRRLAAENTRFSDVLAEVRTARACHCLAHSTLSLSEIAVRLGYSDLSAFSRAFARVAGMSPSQWRRVNRGTK